MVRQLLGMERREYERLEVEEVTAWSVGGLKIQKIRVVYNPLILINI